MVNLLKLFLLVSCTLLLFYRPRLAKVYCFQMIVVKNANFDDFSIGEHVLAHSEPYAIFFSIGLSVCLFVCLCVCVCVCVSLTS